ncbi:hypothetical protein H0H93_009052 [Arthromyces matolae]|nr:hypothetical protein H0H93_009052 [Arthromyces matolae]
MATIYEHYDELPTQATIRCPLPVSYDTRIALPLHAHQHIIVSKQEIQDVLTKADILCRFAIQAGFEESFIQKRPHRIVEVIHFYCNLENISSPVMSAMTSILLPFPVYFHTLNGCSKPEFLDSYPEPVEFDKSPEVLWAGHSFQKLSELGMEMGILKQEVKRTSQGYDKARVNTKLIGSGAYETRMTSDVQNPDSSPLFHVDGVFHVEIDGMVSKWPRPEVLPGTDGVILHHIVRMENFHIWTPESSPYTVAGCETALLIDNPYHSPLLLRHCSYDDGDDDPLRRQTPRGRAEHTTRYEGAYTRKQSEPAATTHRCPSHLGTNSNGASRRAEEEELGFMCRK